MIGLVRSTVSPSSSSMSRSTPWVDGCCGPMLMIMVSLVGVGRLLGERGGVGLGQAQHRSRARAAARRRRRPCAGAISWAPSAVRSTRSVVVVIGGHRGWSSGVRGALELHRDAPDGVVLAQRVAVPVLGHEDAGEVGVAVEADAEHVEHLALQRLGAGVDVEQRRARRVVVGHLDPQPEPLGGARGDSRRRPPRSARARRRRAGRGGAGRRGSRPR